jgi:hypothetical protein
MSEESGMPIGDKKDIPKEKGNDATQCDATPKPLSPNSPAKPIAEAVIPSTSSNNKDTDKTKEKIKDRCNNRCKCLKKWGKIIFKSLEACALLAAIGTGVVIYFQLKEMQEDRNLDERAWVSIILPGYLIQNGQNGQIGMRAIEENTGKTPAYFENQEILIETSVAPFTNVNLICDSKRPLKKAA